MSWSDLHQKLVDDINTAFPSYNAEKTFNPRPTLKDTEDLKVYVVPMIFMEGEMMNRVTYEDHLTYHILLLQRVNDTESEEDIANKGDAIRLRYSGRTIDTYRPHESAKFMPFYDYKDLEKARRITSVIEVTFKDWRANGG